MRMEGRNGRRMIRWKMETIICTCICSKSSLSLGSAIWPNDSASGRASWGRERLLVLHSALPVSSETTMAEKKYLLVINWFISLTD